MFEALVADTAEAVSTAEDPLARAVELVHDHLQTDRVSLVRFEDEGVSFRVMATAGAELCSPGTRLPVATSSHYVANSEGRPFASTSLERLTGFDRSSDQLFTGRGLRSTCSFPLARGRERVGALNMSSFSEGVDFRAAPDELAGLAGLLTLALGSARTQRDLRVLICHEDPIFGMGLAQLCEATGGVRAVVRGSLEETSLTLDAEVPDIVICDNYIGGAGVDEVVAWLRRSGAASAVLVVASHDTPGNASAAVRAGASGYIARVDATQTLAAAIAELGNGRTMLPDVDEGLEIQPLTAREQEVLERLDAGLRVKQFASELNISQSTAKNHARNIFRKLGATSRTEALREARRHGILH